MKYEIIKGSEKDFEGAPEWARFKTSSYYFEGFAQGLRWAYIYLRNSTIIDEGTWFGGDEVYSHHRSRIIAERRPITEPVVNQQLTTEWDGSGVPCVGQKVMSRIGEGVIDYVGTDVVVYSNSGGQWSVRCDCIDYSLSAIRSSEDVARDEAITSLYNVYMDIEPEHGDAVAEGIYDAIAAGRIPGIILSGK